MQKYFHSIQRFLSDRSVGICILMLAIACRLIQLLFFFNIRVDASYQAIASLNMVNGHGISLSQVYPNNLSLTIYEPLIKWPPGFSLLLAPFYLLFGNYLYAAMALHAIAAIALLVFSRGILKLLDTPIYLVNVFTLMTGLFIYSYYIITSTDAIGVSFFIAAIYFFISIIKSQEKWARDLTGITICLLACGILKYLYIPVVMVIPVMIWLRGWMNKNILLKKAGLYSGLIVMAGILAMLGFQQYSGGSAVYIHEPERGFFPGNLLSFYPFTITSFMDNNTVINITGMDPMNLFRIIHLGLYLVVFTLIARYGFTKKIFNTSPRAYFLFASFLISLAISLLLSFLSLTVQKEIQKTGPWTYVEEARYFGPVYLMAQMALMVLLSQSKYRKFLLFFLILFAAEALRGTVMISNRVKNFGKEQYTWQYENEFQKLAGSIIQKEKEISKVEKAVVTGSVFYLNNRITLYSGTPILNEVERINQPSSLLSKEKVLLLVILREEHLKHFQNFLDHPSKTLAGRYKDFYFYTLYIGPN